MNETRKLAIGVDIGGSHISCAAIDLESKEYLEQTFSESELNNHAHADEIMSIWGNTIKETLLLAGKTNVIGVGFAMPGPFDYLKGISLFRGENGKYENTYGLNVPVELRKMLDLDDDFPVRFINDATAFAIGEDRFGMARDHDRSLSITLGTGFGSAFIKDTLPVLEGDEVPGQGCLWHLPFEDSIADDYFSTRGLIKRYKAASGIEVHGVKDIAELAETDIKAREVFNDFGYKMGSFLKPWVEKSGSEVLVMGGNISRAYPLFKESLDRGFDGTELSVKISELKETASMIGSAHLIIDAFYQELRPLLAKM
jgi:glucokinase